MEQFSDAALVKRCLRGDEAAWEALISRYEGLIFSVARRSGLSAGDADDVFQNVCIKLYQHLQSLREIERLGGWLAAVARQEALGVLRRRRFTEELNEASAAPPSELPDALLLAEEHRHAVRQALRSLPEPCQGLLSALYGPDPPAYAVLAQRLGVPVGSIGPRRARCLERLKKILEKSGWGRI